jgi:hypothetical protein
MRLLVIGCLLLSMGQGCAYKRGTIRYADHPELSTVHLYSGREDPRGEAVAVVETRIEERGDCSAVAAKALGQLLADARALGGDGVKDVKFRSRWHWAGRVVCRTQFIGLNVWARGMAYKNSAAN